MVEPFFAEGLAGECSIQGFFRNRLSRKKKPRPKLRPTGKAEPRHLRLLKTLATAPGTASEVYHPRMKCLADQPWTNGSENPVQF